ncbi:MAG: methyltransferase domain-containing protein [Pseudomonadota bacterium]
MPGANDPSPPANPGDQTPRGPRIGACAPAVRLEGLQRRLMYVPRAMRERVLVKAYLEAVRQSTPFAAYKSRLFDMLALCPGERVIDIGCGLGDDVRAAARAVAPEGFAVGVESDRETLTSLAALVDQTEGASFVGADAGALPFADGVFDVARLDRVLHIVDDPLAALSEARRVLAPEGRLLVAEPLWATLRLSGTRLDRSDVARHVERATAAAPGAAAFDPVDLARKAGCGLVEEAPMDVVFEDPGEARTLLHLNRTLFALRLGKQISIDAVGAWQAALEGDAADQSFRARLSGVVLRLVRDGDAQAHRQVAQR